MRRRLIRGQQWKLLFEGIGRRLAALSFTSFAGGLLEAFILLVVVQLAVALTGDRGPIDLQLGPFGERTVAIRTVFVVGFFAAACRLGVQALAARQTASISADTLAAKRTRTFRAFARSSWSIQASEEEGALQDLVVTHVARTSSAVVFLAVGCNAVFNFAALLASAFLLNLVAAAVIVVAVAVLFVLLRPLSRLARRDATEQSAAAREYSRQIVELIGTVQEVRTFAVMDPVLRRVDDLIDDEIRPYRRSQFLGRLVGPSYQVTAIVVLLLGLLVVYAFVDAEPSSLGATVLILIRAMNYSGAVQGSYHHLQELAPYAERLHAEQLRFEASPHVAGEARIPRIDGLAFDDVSYAYQPGVPALSRVSFSVAPGETIGIVGPSGSGKSTLVQLLLRLRQPDEGTYEVNGLDARQIDELSWYSQVAFVPQDSRLLSTSIAENIAFFRQLTRADIERAARAARIHDDIVTWPEGYDTQVGPRGNALSGGQRQRVALARALAGHPSLLVLDEPTSALDMQSEALVHETLEDMKGQVTMFVIAHRLSTLNICDRVMVLDKGEIQAFERRERLEADSEFYRRALALSKVRS